MRLLVDILKMENMLYFGQCVFGHFELLVYLDNVLDRLDQCLLDQYVKYFFMILKHLCTYVAVLNFP